MENFKYINDGSAVIVVDATNLACNKKAISKEIERRRLEINANSISAIVIDNWRNERSHHRIHADMREVFPSVPIIVLHGVDDYVEITNLISAEGLSEFPVIYLWALSRTRIRELVCSFIEGQSALDDSIVTNKLIADIDALNIHRIPSNCIMMLKLLIQSFDDTPVNRTEMIGRILYLLFCRYDKVPSYTTKPGLIDCEYALGYLCQWLVESQRSSFTKGEFNSKVGEYCKNQLITLDSDVLFAFLLSEGIFINKGSIFEFKFKYWMHYFVAHRMCHNDDFAKFILSEGRYAAFPEVIEFYTGIDRRKINAVEQLTNDLRVLNENFQNQAKIPNDLNPYSRALWDPSHESIAEMRKIVDGGLAASALPDSAKDALADKSYQRSSPYNQEMAKFIADTSFVKLIQTMKSAAMALRNSDHVLPLKKMELLAEVIDCWSKMAQLLILISPSLAKDNSVVFDGVGFDLEGDRFKTMDMQKKWNRIVTVIPENVVRWFKEDISSKRMGALFSSYCKANPDTIGELMIIVLMINQRPIGWESEVEIFIARGNKNSFVLNRIFNMLLEEYKSGFVSEKNRSQILRLCGMALSKHESGNPHPGKEMTRIMAERIERNLK